jgi:hypothetical protein
MCVPLHLPGGRLQQLYLQVPVPYPTDRLADPDPAFHLNADPDRDPAPFQSDANLRPLVYYRPSRQCWGSVTFWCGSGSADPYL